MKKILTVLFSCIAVSALLAGCHTVRGVGHDVHDVTHAITPGPDHH